MRKVSHFIQNCEWNEILRIFGDGRNNTTRKQ